MQFYAVFLFQADLTNAALSSAPLRLLIAMIVIFLLSCSFLSVALLHTWGGSDTQFPSSFPGSESGARRIIAGADRAFWFEEQDGDKIGRITTEGSITEFTLPTNDIGDITAGPDGALWFTERESNKIGRITTKGSITESTFPTNDIGNITAGPDGALWLTEIESKKIGRITMEGSITEFTAPS
jgi:virginiamycin B lyase